MTKVNLDALIPREDFAIEANNKTGTLINKISANDLTSHLLYPFLRKPDFQRETSEWSANTICDFIESFINGDLIPSIILWRSQAGYYFVIDGSHRLSALIAWINDDYGDGDISRVFYSNDISSDQIQIAGETRKYINKKVGSYKDISDAPINANANPLYLEKAKNLGAYPLEVQWVVGDSSKAENSFFKINKQGEKLNKTEIKILESRKKANCIAARALIRGGKGHKYWSNFNAENQNQIQDIAKEVNNILFTPPLRTPVKTLDIPIAGKITSAQSLPLILDFINIVNKISHDDFKNILNDDITGSDTLKYLREVRKIAWRINSIHPSSLGLHPVVYFYSADGRHKTASFYAVTAWLMENEQSNKLINFIKIRNQFEDLLLKYDFLIQDINRKYRQAINSYLYVKEFYNECIKLLLDGKNIDETISAVIKDKFTYLKLDIERTTITTSDFNIDRKNSIFIKEALKNPLKCNICKGLIHQNSITFDHIERKQDGGTGDVNNGQIAHPFCNTTVKN